MHFVDSWAIVRTGNNASWSHWAAPPPTPPVLQIFSKPMTPRPSTGTTGTTSATAGRCRAVAVLNRGLVDINATVTWSDIAMNGTDGEGWGASAVRDLWAHEDLGIFQDGFTVTNLASHATRMLLVTEI